MKHTLDFGQFNIINGNIVEITINENIEMSIEMVEECEHFFNEHFSNDFGLLVNKINIYKYAYEAKLTMGTHEKLKAIAVVDYHEEGFKQSKKIAKLRETDGLNMKYFSGLDLGWQQAIDWLKKELS